jgi:hypothetical protein
VSIIYGSMAIVNTCVVFRQQKTPLGWSGVCNTFVLTFFN